MNSGLYQLNYRAAFNGCGKHLARRPRLTGITIITVKLFSWPFIFFLQLQFANNFIISAKKGPTCLVKPSATRHSQTMLHSDASLSLKAIGMSQSFYSHGCQAGSMRHKLSRLLAAATSVFTLLSPPSNWARLCRRVMMAVTAFWTSDTSCWLSMFSGCPAGDRGIDVSSWVFLCQAMISSLSTAFRMPSTWRNG